MVHHNNRITLRNGQTVDKLAVETVTNKGIHKNQSINNSNLTKKLKIVKWNIKGINRKENELLQEFKTAGFGLLAETELKKK